MASSDPGPIKDRRGIQSIDVGMRIIEALRTSEEPQGLTELARSTGVPTSNCHRYLASFVRAGFVTQDRLSSRYDLGPRLVQAGLAAMSRVSAISVADQALVELVAATEKSALLTLWTDQGALAVRWLSGAKVVRANIWPGSRMPLIGSATGSVFLAYLPREETADVLRREARAADIDAVTAQVREAGLGHVEDRHIPGLSAAAAPVLDARGRCAAALTIVTASGDLTPTDLELLRSISGNASRQLHQQEPPIAK